MRSRCLLLRQSWFSTLILVCLSLRCSGADFATDILPLLRSHCLECHSTAKQKGDLDLEQFTTPSLIRKQTKIWQEIVEQISLGEMPPKDKPRLAPADLERLLSWIANLLNEVAREQAGDPGPVTLRRLTNVEYTGTLRELTGIPSLDPAKEFPADSASGEGFMNVGNSLVMSPSLVTKYLAAAKEVAAHTVLLPEGIRFSSSTSQRDWTEESLTAIRALYGRYTETGGGSAVNLQGIQFDTRDGGILPLPRYLESTLGLRPVSGDFRTVSSNTLSLTAQKQGLNPKYLGLLWATLNDSNSSPVLDPIRARWKSAKSGDGSVLAADIAAWQRTLWRFTSIGHIGKRDGPKSWQVPVSPLAEAREVRLKLPAVKDAKELSFYLVTSDAGDGSTGDVAVWENPRLVAAGRPDLPLRSIHTVSEVLAKQRQNLFAQTTQCLAAAAQASANPASESTTLTALAKTHAVDPLILQAWFETLGLGAGEVSIEGHFTSKLESTQTYDFIQGWTGADALSVLANSSTNAVRIPGNMKPKSIAVHPSPSRRVVVSWRSPVTSSIRLSGAVQHAHPECGNGVAWSLELRRGKTRQKLAAGYAQGASLVPFNLPESLAIHPGDVIALVVSPREGNHSCDLTSLDLRISDGTRLWDLAGDVSPNILAGNPHADRQGNLGIWHFHSEPDSGAASGDLIPAGSLLALWQSSSSTPERQGLAIRLQDTLTRGTQSLATNSPDFALHRQLTALDGPLLRGLITSAVRHSSTSTSLHSKSGIFKSLEKVDKDSTSIGLDPALFGSRPKGPTAAASTLVVQSPSVIEIHLPADLAAGYEFVATASLHPEAGLHGSVQMQALSSRPASLSIASGAPREEGRKSTWSDGERPIVSESPILVRNTGSSRPRFEKTFDDFRTLFPAALCYTKIVPVDEVVTLTLYFREDTHFRRLMLDETEAAQLDRHWADLNAISLAPLKLVDAFEQLYQFATQDADPSAFEPLRIPIQQRAVEFKKELTNSQPSHLQSVLGFAQRAFRRPLLPKESTDLSSLYHRLRSEELPHDDAIRLLVARVLVSPAFLYRTEIAPPGKSAEPIDDWELATRLGYFIGTTGPDSLLQEAAATGTLHLPDVLAFQARRLLKTSRSRGLASEFAAAWLNVYEFDGLNEKSERHFPSFNGLRGAMYEETLQFFTDLFQRDGSVLEILDADHTFLNEDLARHYGIPGVKGPEWRRVDGVKAYSRGGILGQATTLAKQSGASRTSPILRGNWLSEVLLGERLPRPPKDVPRLPEDEATETLSVRQLTEKHTSDPRCAGCHRRIDPYGYSLEAFDAIGRLRDRDAGGRPIDTKATVLDGSQFEGINGLRSYLLGKRRDAFLKQVSRKLLGYALGRSIQLSDGPLIEDLAATLKANQYRIGSLIEGIVRSRQFREIRGREMASGDSVSTP